MEKIEERIINIKGETRMTIKAIETEYKGYRFRSRLEARWALFFDEVGIEYIYEKEGFDLGKGIWYLPDFWLPQLKMYMEVKGDNIHEDAHKMMGLAKHYTIGTIGNIPESETIGEYARFVWGGDYPLEGYVGHLWKGILQDNTLNYSFLNFFYKCKKCGNWNYMRCIDHCEKCNATPETDDEWWLFFCQNNEAYNKAKSYRF